MQKFLKILDSRIFATRYLLISIFRPLIIQILLLSTSTSVFKYLSGMWIRNDRIRIQFQVRLQVKKSNIYRISIIFSFFKFEPKLAASKKLYLPFFFRFRLEKYHNSLWKKQSASWSTAVFYLYFIPMDPDPDQGGQVNPYPTGSGSTSLIFMKIKI